LRKGNNLSVFQECAIDTNQQPSSSSSSQKRQFNNNPGSSSNRNQRSSPDYRPYRNNQNFGPGKKTNFALNARPFVPRTENEPLSMNDFPQLN
jgi:hypothetical protein